MCIAASQSRLMLSWIQWQGEAELQVSQGNSAVQQTSWTIMIVMSDVCATRRHGHCFEGMCIGGRIRRLIGRDCGKHESMASIFVTGMVCRHRGFAGTSCHGSVVVVSLLFSKTLLYFLGSHRRRHTCHVRGSANLRQTHHATTFQCLGR